MSIFLFEMVHVRKGFEAKCGFLILSAQKFASCNCRWLGYGIIGMYIGAEAAFIVMYSELDHFHALDPFACRLL